MRVINLIVMKKNYIRSIIMEMITMTKLNIGQLIHNILLKENVIFVFMVR